MSSAVLRRDLNTLAKRLDRLIDKLNDNNVIVACKVNELDPSTWSLHITFRDGGAVMRILTESGRRVCFDEGAPGVAKFPLFMGGVRSVVTVDIHSFQGVVGYTIRNSGDAGCRAPRRILVALPESISSLHTMRGEWLVTLLPEAVIEGSNVRYVFAKVDAQTFLASLVTCKHTYKEITELIERYLNVKLKQELKLIGGKINELCK